MRLLRQSVRGLTVYRDPVTVDFDAMGPGLLAVVGRNGSGKTSCVDAARERVFAKLAEIETRQRQEVAA